MKRRFSLSQLMHNDKLMMLVSLLLAILIWALVVFGPSNTQEQVISGVPISVTLNDYATETLNLRIIDGANATATVKVKGLRSVVSRLSATDIMITADTGNIIKEGTYTLPLRVVSNGDYTIQSVVGPNGNNDTVKVTCDVWREAFFPVSVEMPNLSVADTKNYQIGTPVISNAVVVDGLVTISGSRSDINRVHSVVAVISDEASLSESSVFTAKLEARDEAGNVIDTVAFVNAEDATVSVTVPVLVYRSADLKPKLLNVPAGYKNVNSLVTVTPSKLELWGVPSEVDDFIAMIQEQLVIDFALLSPDNLTRDIYLSASDGIRMINGEESVSLRVNLYNIVSKNFEVTVSEENFVAKNVPKGYTATAKQTKVIVTLCGPARVINSLKTTDITITANLPNGSNGMQTVLASVSAPKNNTVWPIYTNGKGGMDLLVSIDKAAE